MLKGFVNSRNEALVTVTVLGLNGSECEIDAVIDTGFNGGLTIPTYVMKAMGLTVSGQGMALLADGSLSQCPTCIGDLRFGSREIRQVSIDVLEGPPLVGMRMLAGCHLGMDVVTGDMVTIDDLPPTTESD